MSLILRSTDDDDSGGMPPSGTSFASAQSYTASRSFAVGVGDDLDDARGAFGRSG